MRMQGGGALERKERRTYVSHGVHHFGSLFGEHEDAGLLVFAAAHSEHLLDLVLCEVTLVEGNDVGVLLVLL